MRFGRRSSRASSREPLDRSTNSSAAAAASAAFSHDTASNANLSSAAAAAALRSHTTTPEPVGSIQTKRMVRRGSGSSVGSDSGVGSSIRGGRGGLQRRDSGGSMTERTFRSPSPARSNEPVSPAADAPPVPAIPRNLAKSVPYQRANSMDQQQRVMSPTPGRGGKSASMDRANVQPRPTTPKLAKRAPNVAEIAEQDRQNNVNFSRPMSSYASTPVKNYTHGTGSWFSGATGAASLADDRPRSSDGVSRESGIHGTGRHQSQPPPQVSYQAADSLMVYDPNTRTFVPQRREKPKAPDPTPSAIADADSTSYDPNTRKVISRPGTPKSASGGLLTPDTALKAKKAKPSLPAVQTLLEPPPKNPARYPPSGSISPTSPRAAGILHKQPSVVREDPEGEARAAKDSPPSAIRRNMRTPAGPAKAYVASTEPVHGRSSSLDIPRPSDEPAERGRNISISPQRSAHFSESPVSDAHIHVPPPRDSSPVKSAMKHSPASSIRANSPLLIHSARSKAPESEAGSEISEDSAFIGKRKKGARVSFDEQPREIDAASAAAAPKAIASSNLTPVSSPRSRSPAVVDDTEETIKPRPALPSFSSVRRTRMSEVAEKVTETPPDRAEKGVSSDNAVGGILAQANMERNALDSLPLPPEVTSKASSGSVSDESEDESSFRPETAGTPMPVGRRRISVDEKDMKDVHQPKVKDFASPSSLEAGQAQRVTSLVVPSITLLPPTPGIDEEGKTLGEVAGVNPQGPEAPQIASPKPKKSMEMFSVPGSWMDSDDNDVAPPVSSSATTSRPAEIADQSAPVLHAHVQQVDEPLAAPTLKPIDEDSDDSAAFSDAAEDLSDFEDGGFASLDAIASSPIVPASVEKAKVPAGPESPISPREGRDGNWTHATAYWSQLSRQQREQIERSHLSSDDEARPKAAAAPKPKKKKSALGSAAGSSPSPQPILKQQQVQIVSQQRQAAQPSQPALKKTMRAAQSGTSSAAADSEIHMRRSMRASPTRQRPQSDFIEPRGALQKRNVASRPMSSGAAAVAAQPQRPRNDHESTQALQRLSIQSPPLITTASSKSRVGPQPSSKAATEKLQKQATNDSDSESSFKKRRRPSANTADSTGRYSMRRSMRVGSVDRFVERPTSPPSGGKGMSGAYSVRSNSPSGSAFSGMKRETLRSSMRPGSVDAAPMKSSLRSTPAAGGRSGNASATVAPSRKSAFKSRFAPDSDDEDEERPSRSFIKSRFVDSDDEDERGGVIKADLTPVRGIPRRRGQEDGDSTDLEDEDEDDGTRKASKRREKQVKPIVPDSADVDRAMEAARRKLGIGLPAVAEAADGTRERKEGNALTQGSLRSPAGEKPDPSSRAKTVQTAGGSPIRMEKKKSGFMGSLLRRNRHSSPSVPIVSGQPDSPTLQSPALLGAAPSTPSSPARAKLQRRSSAQPKLMRGDSSLSTTAAAPLPTSEGTLRRKDSENWPLAPAEKIMVNGTASRDDKLVERPTTSDGVGRKVRIQGREDDELVPGETSPEAGYSQRTGKKKKFSMLRRAFRLGD